MIDNVHNKSVVKVMSEDTPGAIVRKNMGVLVTLNARKFKKFDDAASLPPSKESQNASVVSSERQSSSSSDLAEESKEHDHKSQDSSVEAPKKLPKRSKQLAKDSKQHGASPASKDQGNESAAGKRAR